MSYKTMLNLFTLNRDLITLTKSNKVMQLKALQAEIANDILMQGADVNHHDYYGYTPLLYATYFGNEKLVDVLIEYGANTEYVNKFGRSAKDYAQLLGYTEIDKMLSNRRGST